MRPPPLLRRAAPAAAESASGEHAVDAPAVRRLPSLRLDGLPRTVVLVAAVAALTGLATVLRLRALTAPYWIDEGISVGIASHPLGEIPGLLRLDGSPPLYYVVLHVWISLFGSAPTATHALSAIFAIACVPAAYWAVAPFGAWAALSGAAIMALSPYVGLYADETRMYSLLLLLGLAVCGAFVRAFIFGRRAHIATFAVFAALTLYTHAWGAFLVGAAGLGWLLLLVLGPNRRRLLLDGVIGFGGAAVLFAPWLPTLLYQAAHTGAPWSHRPSGRSLVRAMSRIWSGRRAEEVLLVTAAAGLVVALVQGRGPTRRAVLTLLLMAVATLGSAYAYSRYRSPAWAIRYLVVVLAPFAVVAALGLGRLRALGPAVVAAIALLVWHGRPTVSTLSHKSNVTAVAKELRPDLPPGTVVFSTQPEQVPLLAHDLPPGMRFVTPLGPVADARVMDWRDAMPRLRNAHYDPVLGRRLRRMSRGQRLLFVQPQFGNPDAPWTRRIRFIARKWGRAVRHSTLMRRVRVIVPAHGYSRSTVTARLLVRR